MNSLREAYTKQKRSFSHVKNKEGGAGITLKDLSASHDDRPSRRENISLTPFTNDV